jgi:hypothetical protein
MTLENMKKAEKRIDECYFLVLEIISDIDNDVNLDKLFIECKDKIKGLKEVEFFGALGLEGCDSDYEPDVLKYLKKIKYL